MVVEVASVVGDRKALEGMLREAAIRAGHKGSVELPTAVAIEFAKLIDEAAQKERMARLSSEALFRTRVPEAAARQTATVLAWSAEASLGNLAQMRERKRTSKGDLNRMEDVCAMLVAQCDDLGVEPIGLRGQRCVRLEAAMQTRGGGEG